MVGRDSNCHSDGRPGQLGTCERLGFEVGNESRRAWDASVVCGDVHNLGLIEPSHAASTEKLPALHHA